MDPHTASDSELADFCLHGPPDRIIGGIPYGPQVVRVSDRVVIKYSWHLTKFEAETQARAYELVDPSIVRIPRVHRYFRDEQGIGYMMMEFLEGKTIDPLEDPALIDRVVKVLDHFSTILGQKPGNLAGGPCAGILWESSQPLNFSNKSEMEAWLNSQLLPGEGTVSFQESDLVLCHLDIAPRNIIWRDDGTLCIVDWESAGFYPRLFEFWTHWNIEGKDGNFNSLLLNAMTPLPSHELAQKDRVCRLWYNTQKYAFLTPEERRLKKLRREQWEKQKRAPGFIPPPVYHIPPELRNMVIDPNNMPEWREPSAPTGPPPPPPGTNLVFPSGDWVTNSKRETQI